MYLETLGNPSAATEDQRITALQRIVRATPALMRILRTVKDLGLPDAWLVSGGIYQTVWNVLTDRPPDFGIKDYDVIYFDGTDLSYEAEDRVIRDMNAALPDLADKLEVRNQARVHLWYEKRFGRPYFPLSCAMESLTTYAAKTHAVAVRLGDGGAIDVQAPFGLSPIFAMRLVPNPLTDNRPTYDEKAERMMALWPELTVVDWDAT
ncbi:nucleotidyltransferase family protein [uncultured Roseibium sp.]|uniref:nucleotidyltransferase family protein n=1 Tax=uncultured Roseibium sp. TaxID=1936171 RepID=UPI0032166721